jgi:hypothetical protein
MEQTMPFRIFDHLLVNHGWTATGCLVVSDAVVHGSAAGQAERAHATPTAERSADIERRSLLARLAYRGKHDRILCRAARYLEADPSLSVQWLAAKLGVSESYLSRALEAALGQGAHRLFR